MEDSVIKILLVEDNPGDARLVKETLADAEGLDFQLTHVERLSEARKALGKDQFDVVLLDLMLPDKPRMGSLIEIHDQARRVPIVVLTGMDDDMVESWSMEEGAQDYVVKGKYDQQSLVRSIRHAIQRHAMQKEQKRVAPARFAGVK